MTPILHSPPELRREDFWFQEKNQEFFAWKTMPLEQYVLQNGALIVNKDRKRQYLLPHR